MSATEMPHVPSAALNTSEGARRFIADFFATELHRHDFTAYISTRLAADFACALAQHLASTGKQQAGEPEIEFQARLMDVKTDLPTENWRHSPTYDENPGRGTHYWVQFRKRYIYYTPPAQGIDLGQQQDAARWRAIAPLLSVEWDEDEQLKRWTWIDFNGDAPAIPSPTRQEYASVDEAVDALIDQRDAAPEVGSRTDHLLDRRNRLMNSYGNGDREDAALDEQIAKIDAELADDQRDAAPGVGNG